MAADRNFHEPEDVAKAPDARRTGRAGSAAYTKRTQATALTTAQDGPSPGRAMDGIAPGGSNAADGLLRQPTEGRAWRFGDNLSTDHILPSRFMTQVKPHELAAHCLAGADPDFAAKVRLGDIVVAGLNAGYGSSREQAPQALKHAGVSAIIAASFARIFYRNCYNIGLPAIICPALATAVKTGDILRVDLTAGTALNLTSGREYHFMPPPVFLLEYIRLGGLIPYLADQMGAPAGAGKEEK